VSDRPCNVCMFSNMFPPVVSGSAIQSSSLARELASRGHRPFVICARVDETSDEYEELDGVPVYRLPAIKLPKLPIALNSPWLSYTFTPGNIRRVIEIFERHRPEAIHLHNHMFDLALMAVSMRKRFAIPLIVTLHTMIRHSNPLYNVLLYPADRLVLRRLVAEQSETLICPDENILEYAQRVFPRTGRALIPYGIDILDHADRDQVERFRGLYGLDGKRVILSLGHVHGLRDRRELVAALPAVRKAVGDVVVIIVGDEGVDTPRKLAADLGVSDSVIFTGHIPRDQVAAHLALADIEMHLFYQDSGGKDSLGMASLEAMGSGLSVIGAAHKDTYGKGLLRDGENVCLVRRGMGKDLEQVLIDLLQDRERRERIGLAAGKLVGDHFSWDSTCRQTLDAYSQAGRRRNMQTRL
jgi:glycosyltransferase involved in cell wall biosynthesis